MPLADLRREYRLLSLQRKDLDPDPIAQFTTWFDQAAGARRSGRLRRFLVRFYKVLFTNSGLESADVNAAVLATADRTGRPSARVVLLKGVDQRGFIFFTNYESRKGRDLAANPWAALVFYWSDQERQVCITGHVTKISREESEAYFKSRPKSSRLAALASQQSAVVENRAALDAQWKAVEALHPDDDVPMPASWGGYVLAPESLEFWQGRPARLHDRFRYTKQPDKKWRLERLCP